MSKDRCIQFILMHHAPGEWCDGKYRLGRGIHGDSCTDDIAKAAKWTSLKKCREHLASRKELGMYEEGRLQIYELNTELGKPACFI